MEFQHPRFRDFQIGWALPSSYYHPPRRSFYISFTLITSLEHLTNPMSRPSTPMGLSPRGSFINVSQAANHDNGSGSLTPTEKGRIKAELEIHQALLKAEDGVEKAKKEEVGMPVGSPGESETEFNSSAGDERRSRLR